MKRSPMPARRTGLRSGKPLRRGKELRSKVVPRRRATIPAVNPKRKARSFILAYGSRERVEWLLGFPCATSGGTATDASHVIARKPKGRGGPEHMIPQGHEEHMALHAEGVDTFEDRRGLPRGTLLRLAAKFDRMWRSR